MGLLTQRTTDDAAALQDPRPLVSAVAAALMAITVTSITGACFV